MEPTKAFRLLVVLVCLSSSRVEAQTGDRDIQSADSTQSVSPRTRAYLRQYGEQAPAYVTQAGWYQVLVTTTQGAIALDTLPVSAAVAPGCHSPDLRPTVVPADAVLPVAAGESDFVVVAMPWRGGQSDRCREAWNDNPVAYWRGLGFPHPTRHQIVTPHALGVLVDGVPVAGRVVERSASVFTSGTWSRAGSRLVGAYPMSALAPRADGRPRVVRLLVVDEAGDTTRVELPDIWTRWRAEFAAWRIVTASDSSRAMDPMVARAARAAQSLGRSRLEYDSRQGVVAAALAADALVAAGDTTTATSIVTPALDAHACLVPPASGSPFLRVVAARRFDVEACRERPIHSVLLAGLLLPGGGHAAGGHRELAVAAGGIVGGVLAGAVKRYRDSMTRYHAYQAAGPDAGAPQLYDEAMRMRADTRKLARIAGTLWITDAALASIIAWRHNRRLASERL